MMFDILRTMKKFPDIYNCINEVALVETSPRLMLRQQEMLKIFSDVKISWYQSLKEVVGSKFFIIANEFLDALPIKQYHFENGQAYEIIVSLDENDQFVFGLTPASHGLLDINNLKEHKFLELSMQREGYSELIARKIADGKGEALIIDYGYLTPPGKSTLQAVGHHKKVDIFESIGRSDITSLVDFAALRSSFAKFNIKTEVVTQGDFLFGAGILERAEMLIKASAIRDKIQYQIEKLTSQKEMGELFKVLRTL
jgi:SAM-dependent MidA family methyltransferase